MAMPTPQTVTGVAQGRHRRSWRSAKTARRRSSSICRRTRSSGSSREIAALGTVPPEVGEQVLDELHQIGRRRRRTSRRRRRSGAPAADQDARPRSVAPHPRSRRAVVPHERRVRLAREGQPAAAVEVLPRRASADDRADPGAPQRRQRRAAARRSCPTTCAPTCCCAWPASRTSPPDVIARISSVIEQRLRGLGGPTPRAARRRARGGRAVQPPRSQRQPAGARADRERRRRTWRSSIRNLMFVFDDLVAHRGHRHPRDRQPRRQEGADDRAQGRERGHPRSASSRTCRSAPPT